MTVCLDSLKERDIPALLALANEIGWGYNRENWLQFMSLGTVLGHRDEAGNPVSSAVMVEYGSELFWLTSFIVSPRFQRRGLAQEMWFALKRKVDEVNAPVGLASTDQGLPFYMTMGFRQVGTVKKLVRQNGLGLLDGDSSPKGITSILPEDFGALVELDRESVGAQRDTMIHGKLKNATATAKIVGNNGELQGFAISVMEGDLLCVGPVLAPSGKAATQLVQCVANGHPGRVRLDLVPENLDVMNSLLNMGFMQDREPPLLCYGTKELPKRSQTYIAIAAQALG